MSAHPEIPNRRLRRVVFVSLSTGVPTDITDSVIEIVEHAHDDDLGCVVTARYIKDTP